MITLMKLTDEAFRLKLDQSGEKAAPVSALVSAQNDTAAFQILIRSDHAYTVSCGRSDYFSAKGRLQGPIERYRVAIECPLEVTMNLEGFMTDDDGIEKADVLLGYDVVESRPNTPTAIYAEVKVPKNTAPGTYCAVVRVYGSRYLEDEKPIAEETVTIHVYPYEMPDAKDFRFYLDLWQHNANIARKSDVPLWSDAHFKVMQNYLRTLGQLGNKAVTVIASEIPWSGQGCMTPHEFGGNMFEYSIIGVTREENGEFSYDYGLMQRYIDMAANEGITGEIEVFGLVNVWEEKLIGANPCPEYPEAIRIRYFDKADGCYKYMKEPEQIDDYVRSLEAYFIESKQIDRVRIAADEPSDVEKYKITLERLQKIAPRFRCKCAINHAEFIEEFHERIDDFVPHIACVVKEFDRLSQYKKTYTDKNFLWYVCVGGHSPNNYLRSPLIDNRFIGIATAYFKFDGFLRWNYTIWPEDPRKDIRYSAFEAGDTNFVYPAYNGDVLLSLRYKNLQRGIYDFELLTRLRELCGEEAAEDAVTPLLRFSELADFIYRDENGLAPSQDLFSLQWEDYNQFKKKILTELCQ